MFINGKEAKASTKVKIGDILELHFGEKILRVKVLDLKEHVGKDEAASLYEVIE